MRLGLWPLARPCPRKPSVPNEWPFQRITNRLVCRASGLASRPPTPSWLIVEATQGLPAAGENQGCERGQSNLMVASQPLCQLTSASHIRQTLG